MCEKVFVVVCRQNQYIAIATACYNGLPECLQMASEKFANWMDTNNNT